MFFGFLMFFCSTKTKMVTVNFVISLSWCIVIYLQDAKAGLLISAIAGLSSLYSAVYNKIISKKAPFL
jgi:hypothetical protein